MQQDLEFKAFLPLVPDVQHSPQSALTQSDTVHKAKVIQPSALRRLWECTRVQSKVELDTIVGSLAAGTTFLRSLAFRSRLAEKFPTHIPGEAVLRVLGRSMILWRRTEILDQETISSRRIV
jgi:hypothetical protein